MTTPARSSTPLRQYARLALVLFALLAFGTQQWAARTHWHGTSGVAALEAGNALAGGGNPADAPRDRHPDCLWCHLAAHAGAIAPPPDLVRIARVEAAAPALVPVPRPAQFVPPPAFAWRSRGPPA